jgi:transposase-like protein
MRKTKKHKVFSIEEKNQIVLIYLDRHMGRAELMRTYDISSFSVLHRWITQYKKYGTCVDFRGKATKIQSPSKGRPRKYPEKLDNLTKEQLIERLNLYKDIKKSLAYLNNEQQNKNTKS